MKTTVIFSASRNATSENSLRRRGYEVKRYQSVTIEKKNEYAADYKRLKYTDQQQAEYEKQLDEFLLNVRSKIKGANLTKKEAIDKCLLEKRYDQKLIMYTTMSYQSTVYERNKYLQTTKKL